MAKKRKKTPREKRPFSFNLDFPKKLAEKRQRQRDGTMNASDIMDIPKEMKDILRKHLGKAVTKRPKSKDGKSPKHEPKMTK